ncbi:hypothetical protein [Ferroplasma sp.]|nr:hypothetical protein [Ferroplasma sp.]
MNTPFAVSGGALWYSMKNNYLYNPDQAITMNSSDCRKHLHGNA